MLTLAFKQSVWAQIWSFYHPVSRGHTAGRRDNQVDSFLLNSVANDERAGTIAVTWVNESWAEARRLARLLVPTISWSLQPAPRYPGFTTTLTFLSSEKCNSGSVTPEKSRSFIHHSNRFTGSVIMHVSATLNNTPSYEPSPICVINLQSIMCRRAEGWAIKQENNDKHANSSAAGSITA